MLRVTVELIPLGNESKKKEIAKIEIANTGKKYYTDETEYTYKGYVEDEPVDGKEGYIHKFSGRVGHWRPSSVLVLLYKVIFKEVQSYIHI
jgi:hypothetical protein